MVSYGGSGKRGRFFAQLAPAGNRLRLVGEMKRPGITAPAHIHSIYSWGRLGRCPKLPCKLTPEPHFTALLADAEVICKQMLSRAPSHATCLNLLGVVYQASARHRLAIKLFAKAIAVDDLDAGFHYNIACSYQATGQPIAAAEHFKTAITPLKPIILKLLGACTFSQSRRPEDLSSIEGRVFAWPAWLQIVYQT